MRTSDLNVWQPLEGLAVNTFRQHMRHKADQGSGRIPRVGPLDEHDFWKVGDSLVAAQESRRGPNRAELEEVANAYRVAAGAGSRRARVLP